MPYWLVVRSRWRRSTLPGSFSTEYGESAARQALTADPRPTAVIAGGNQLLIGCLRVLREMGLKVAQDISLVTCDDVPLSELYEPPIASIAARHGGPGPDRRGTAHRSAGGWRRPRTEYLPTTFQPRPSCAPPAHR